MRTMFTLMLICASVVAQAFNYGYGYSEVFIRVTEVNEPGVYTIRIDDQIITNANGKFRFFDLRPGVKEIYIQRNGYNLFKGIVSIYNGSRTVAEYRGMNGLFILQQVQLMNHNQYQQQTNWYGWNYYMPNQNYPNNPGGWNQDQWNPNNPNQNYPNNPNQNYPNNPYPNTPPPVIGMDANTFGQFKQTVKNQSFDSNKVTVIKTSAKTANFTSAQVAELLELFSFDSYRLEAAKYCYDYVIDKGNYFKTYDKFSFDSYVKDLTAYIANR